LSLVGLEDPSVAVRCCPLLFKPLTGGAAGSGKKMMIDGDYRIVFAVVTITSVFLYDTQHPCPFAKFTGLHLAPINDAAWAVSSVNSSSNIVLSVCSSDEDGALGEVVDSVDVPEAVKRTYPHLYSYEKPTEEVSIGTVPVVPNESVSASIQAELGNPPSPCSSPEPPIVPATEEPVVATENPAKETTASTQQHQVVEEKKRKRIHPTTIAPLGNSAAVTAAISLALRENAANLLPVSNASSPQSAVLASPIKCGEAPQELTPSVHYETVRQSLSSIQSVRIVPTTVESPLAKSCQSTTTSPGIFSSSNSSQNDSVSVKVGSQLKGKESPILSEVKVKKRITPQLLMPLPSSLPIHTALATVDKQSSD